MKFSIYDLRFAICGVVGAGLLSATSLQAEALLLSNAVVHTVTGKTLSPGQVLVKDGKIDAVGASLVVGGVKVVDLNGQHLYPGLIALNTSLGLVEIGAVRATRDTTEVGEFTPDVQSWTAINPDSELIPVARFNGVAYAQPVPQGGIVAGQSGLVVLEGWTWEQMTIKRPVALHLFWPQMELDTRPKEEWEDKSKWKSVEEQGKERQKKLKGLDDFFAEARAYEKARQAAGKNGVVDPGLSPSWEAMRPYVRGELPLMVHADEIRQIRTAVLWAQTNQYKMILAGGRDSWKAADLLATNKVPVVYDQVFGLPPRDTDAYDIQFRTPEILHKAGVKVVFSVGPGDASLVKNIPYAAAQAVAFGLPELEALKGMTLYPAQLLGVADRLGSIEVGKEATLFVADGNILDIRSNVKRMWITGKEISLENRHTRLYEKYRNRPLPK
ncbi:MAG: amidohydrolase family protein [Verrucomicrobia bacterium]|nr:amidohydrolase family protein [Verrucomicrobiota bacterium]